jgi:carboxyl-terminal processing protease
MNSFILDYIDNNRESLKNSYPEFKDYEENFKVSEEMLNNLYNYAKSEGLKRDEEGIQTSEKEIKLLTKALIARDLWDMSEYFQVVNKQDKVINKAIEALENWDTYSEKYLNK